MSEIHANTYMNTHTHSDTAVHFHSPGHTHTHKLTHLFWHMHPHSYVWTWYALSHSYGHTYMDINIHTNTTHICLHTFGHTDSHVNTQSFLLFVPRLLPCSGLASFSNPVPALSSRPLHTLSLLPGPFSFFLSSKWLLCILRILAEQSLPFDTFFSSLSYLGASDRSSSCLFFCLFHNIHHGL